MPPGRGGVKAMRPGGFEPPTNSLEGCCSIHLSYGRHTVGLSDRPAGVGAAGFEPATSWSQTRRATGLRHTPNKLDGETSRRLDAQEKQYNKLNNCYTRRRSAWIGAR